LHEPSSIRPPHFLQNFFRAGVGGDVNVCGGGDGGGGADDSIWAHVLQKALSAGFLAPHF